MTTPSPSLSDLAVPSLAVAKARTAELRAAAERARLVRGLRRAQAVRRPVPWPAAVVAALRDSLALTPANRSDRRSTTEPCPTC